MEIKDIKLSKVEPFEVKWKELLANIFDDGRRFCAESFDGQYCCTGTIVDYKNLDNENPVLNVLRVYKIAQTVFKYQDWSDKE